MTLNYKIYIFSIFFFIYHSVLGQESNWLVSNSTFSKCENIIIDPYSNKKHKFIGSGNVFYTNKPNSIFYSNEVTKTFKIEFNFLQDQNGFAFFRIAENLTLNFKVNQKDGFGYIQIGKDHIIIPNNFAERKAGIWQSLELIFLKNENSKYTTIEKIILNDIIIHSNIIIQEQIISSKIGFENISGVLALKNLVFDNYLNTKPISITNLNYLMNPTDDWQNPTVISDSKFYTAPVNKITNVFKDKFDRFKLVYTGDLMIAETNNFKFSINFDGLAYLKIDDKEIITTNEYTEHKAFTNSIRLEKGKHSIKYTYYNIYWRPALKISVSGYGFKPYDLSENNSLPDKPLVNGVYIDNVIENVKIVRSFIHFNESKRTSVLSVGSNKKIHYTFDLDECTLLYAWKGAFADLTEMWFERGEPQIIQPMGLLLKLEGYQNLNSANSDTTNKALPIRTSYILNQNGFPEFNYSFLNQKITQSFFPENDELVCNIQKTGTESLMYTINKGKQIIKISKNLFKIDQHYVKIYNDLEPQIVSINDKKALVVKFENNLKYSLIW